jgi:hypothetical protein
MAKILPFAYFFCLLIAVSISTAAGKTKAEIWLDHFKRIRGKHSKDFAKARKEGTKLAPLRLLWLKVLIDEDQRASNEIAKKDSPIKRAASKQRARVRIERLRLLFDLGRVKEAQRLTRLTLNDKLTRQASRTLQIINARRRSPETLPKLYKQILKDHGSKVPTLENRRFQIPPKNQRACLLWIWLPKHPLSRHNIEEYQQTVAASQAQLIALKLPGQSPSKRKKIAGVIERELDPKASAFRSQFCISASPLKLFFDKSGTLQLVDPTVKELDAWFRQQRSSAKKP